MNVPALIEKMLVLFFAMAAGFVCGKRGWLDDTANRTISRLVVMLTNPMLALSSVMGKERLMSNRQVLALTGISFALILSCMLLSRVVVRLLHAEEKDRGLLRFLFSFCNISYIGYPVVQSLFGMDASAKLVSSARWHFHLLAYTSFLLTMFGTFGRSVVSSGQDPLVLHYDSTDPSSETGRSLGYQVSHLHEIFVIVRTFHAGSSSSKYIGYRKGKQIIFYHRTDGYV